MQTRLQQLETELEALRHALEAAHEKQRAGDEVFKRFSDSGLMGIALFERGGKLVFANEAVLKMTGYRAEELAAGTARWDELTPPEWRRQADAALAELDQYGSFAPHEREYLRRDGTRFWGLCTGVFMAPQIVVFLLDVTERKKADEVLRFQARLLDAVEQAVIATDLEGTITHWNRFAERLYGWPAEAVIGRNVLELTLAESRGGDPAAIMARLQRGESWSGELLLQRQDGSLFPAWVNDSPIYDDAGRLVGIVGVSSDITARKEALAREQEARARAEEAQRLHQVVEGKLSLLTEATGALIGSLSIERVLAETLALSRRLVAADAYAIWRQATGDDHWEIAASEGLSETYRTSVIGALRHAHGVPDAALLVPDVDHEPLLAGHRSHLAKEGIRAMLVLPLLMPSAPGGTLVFYYHQPHVFNEIELKVSSALANLAASAIAMTELYEAASQRADQLAEADRLKDQYLAMLAHELRNPLGAISNAVHVARRAVPGTSAFERAQAVIDRQSRHMTRLVDELLDVSRISRGKISLRRERLDLAQLVRETGEDHRRILEEAGLSLTLELPEAPLCMAGDPTRLRQALGNLLQNAAKFTPAGGAVGVQVFRYSGIQEKSSSGPERLNTRTPEHLNTPAAVLTVADTGIGIPPELLPRLFEPFVQAERSLDRTGGGLGLGLALVKGIVELHGGCVVARSEGAGHGATFTIELPLADVGDWLPDGDDKAGDASALDPGLLAGCSRSNLQGPAPPRVLIIEDNADAAETLRALLEIFGYRVEVASSGPAGVAMAQRARPDVVLCDLGLPGMDGYAVAAALRANPVTTSARLIAVSGYGRDEDRRRSAAAGFDAHLVKPVDAELLQPLLDNCAR